MEIGNNKKKKLIKGLLSDPLTQERKQMLSELESVENEMKKQWEQSDKPALDPKVKQLIWGRIQRKCNGKQGYQVHRELWYFLAASVAILLIVGSSWFISNTTNTTIEEYIKVAAKSSQMYVLPDSSKVWMQPGSSIRYVHDFNKNRKVWLEGNALFEVYSHQGSAFRVYLNKAFIEVKGTCFSVKQDDATQNEITLFKGSIDFTVETQKETISMRPMQKIIYNAEKACTKLENIANISWENGKYNFIGMPLTHLIQVINQMYNSNIILKENIKKESAFTGSIRYDESIDDVLDKICYTLNLNMDKRNDKITIYP